MIKHVFNVLIVILSTIFGIGFLPVLGGTVASLVACFVFYLIKNSLAFFCFTMISLVVAFSISGYAEELFDEKDSKKIVIDDFSGMLVALLFIPHRFLFVFIAFFLFRIFDFFKVYPANVLEKFKGAKGVVGDDLVAGFYTNILLQVLKVALKISS